MPLCGKLRFPKPSDRNQQTAGMIKSEAESITSPAS